MTDMPTVVVSSTLNDHLEQLLSLGSTPSPSKSATLLRGLKRLPCRFAAEEMLPRGCSSLHHAQGHPEASHRQPHGKERVLNGLLCKVGSAENPLAKAIAFGAYLSSSRTKASSSPWAIPSIRDESLTPSRARLDTEGLRPPGLSGRTWDNGLTHRTPIGELHDSQVAVI